jgi:trehalose 6-phosphate phosphatase
LVLSPHIVAQLDTLAAAHGVAVEYKPFGVALHYRLAPKAEHACRSLAAQIAAETDLVVQPGKMVFELKHAAADKGLAVARLMRESSMADGKPLFIGDDATDEAGFAMVAKLGGAGVLVGAMRPTTAAYRLPGVPDTLAWLRLASSLRQ